MLKDLVTYPDDYISKLLLSNLLNPKYKINRWDYQITWIQEFIKLSEDVFKNIINKLSEVFPDNHIESTDIPFFVHFVSKTYFDQVVFLGIYSHEILFCFTIFTIDVLIDNKFFNIEQYEEDKIHKLIIAYISSFYDNSIHKKNKTIFQKIKEYSSELIKSITDPIGL